MMSREWSVTLRVCGVWVGERSRGGSGSVVHGSVGGGLCRSG